MGAESGLAERLLALGDARDEDEVDREQRRLEVAKDASDLVLQGRLSLLHLVAMKQTKHLLTSDSKLARTEGTLLLAEVVKGTLTVLTKHEVDHVLAFFCERLKDWHTLRATLSGCRALLGNTEGTGGSGGIKKMAAGSAGTLSVSEGTRLTRENAKLLARSLFEHVDVQSHSQPNRQLCFEIVDALLREPYDEAVLELAAAGPVASPPDSSGSRDEAGEDLLEVLVRFLDGEKDPRCLLLAFGSIERAVGLLRGKGGRELDLAVVRNAAALADVLSCYFPLSFSPPKDAAKTVTREDLLEALFSCYCSTPSLFPHLIQLLEDRFPSPKSETKVEGLRLLGYFLEKFAGDLRADYEEHDEKKQELEALVDQAWDLLRAQISQRQDTASTVADASCDVASRALEALGKLADLLGPCSLKVVDLAFEDAEVVAALAACASGPSGSEDPPHRPKSKTMAHCRALEVLSTVAGSSVLAFAEVLRRTREAVDVLQGLDREPILAVHFVFKMTLALGGLERDASTEGMEEFRVELPDLCRALLRLLPRVGMDAEDDFRTASECLGALENCCALRGDWIGKEVVEEVVMGLVEFSLSPGGAATEDHGVRVALVVSRVHRVHRDADLVDRVIRRTLEALAAGGEWEGDRALLMLAVIAEERCELSTDIAFKLTHRAVLDWGHGSGPCSRVTSSILTKIGTNIMPHLYKCTCDHRESGGTLKPVSKIVQNLIRLLERALAAGHGEEEGVLRNILCSLSYTTMLCTEEMRAEYAAEAVGLLASGEEALVVGEISTSRPAAAAAAAAAEEDAPLLSLNPASEVAGEARHLVAAAVLTPLGVPLPQGEAEDVLHALLGGALGAGTDVAAGEISVALAGRVNGLGSSQVEEIVVPLVTEVLLSHVRSCESGEGVSSGLTALAWIARALAMRKHKATDAVLDEMFSVLCDPENNGQALSLGRTFSAVISTEHDALVDTWGWTAKLLWRQKLFVSLSSRLFARLEQNKGEPDTLAGLHQVFSHLVKSVHFSVLKPSAKEVVRHLVASVPLLLSRDQAQAAGALAANLETLKTALADDAMRGVVEDEVGEAVAALVAASGAGRHNGGRSSALLRRRALECIALLVRLPHHVLYPFFHEVRKQLDRCLDDDKREVRSVAGSTMRAWRTL